MYQNVSQKATKNSGGRYALRLIGGQPLATFLAALLNFLSYNSVHTI